MLCKLSDTFHVISKAMLGYIQFQSTYQWRIQELVVGG